MNRKERVRAAGDNARETARHAADVVGPYAASARESASQYAHDASAYLKPRARKAACAARENYASHVVPRLEQARQSLPEGVDEAAGRAADRTRDVARKARAAAAPRLEQARAAAGPAAEKAAARSAAAYAGLRGDLSAKDVRKAVRRRRRRAAAWTTTKWVGVAGVIAGGAYVAWRWWDQQANPDWLVEPPVATEVGQDAYAEERGGAVDPEVEAKQAEAEAEADGGR
ncbi:DUF5324 family protein [Streptomyces lonarensis]